MTILAFFVVGGTTGADIAVVPERARRRTKAAMLFMVIFIVFVEGELVAKIGFLLLPENFKK
jgi:hypothetical protein